MSDAIQADAAATRTSNGNRRVTGQKIEKRRAPTTQRHIPLPSKTKALKAKVIEERSLTPEQLDDYVMNYYGTLTNVAVTPELAAYILEKYNTGNRRMRKQQADTVAKTIGEGRWFNTGEPLIFALEKVERGGAVILQGILNNGQHRLQAIVNSARSILIDIRFGISRDAFAMTDTGSKRLAGDVLTIEGCKTGNASAAALKLLIAYQRGLPNSYNSGNRTGNDEIIALYNKLKTIDRAVELVKRIMKRKGFNAAATNAFAYLAMMETNEETVAAFLKLIDLGSGDELSPTRQIFELLSSDEARMRSDRIIVCKRFAFFIKGWQQHRGKGRPKVIRYDPNRETFPQMKYVIPE